MNSMLLTYIQVALINLQKHVGFSAIKILSLTLGLSCSILILMHVQYARNFDMHFQNAKNIYRLGVSFSIGGDSTDMSMTSDAYAPQLKLDYPQIQHVVKIRPNRAIFSRNEVFSQNNYHWAEQETINLFSLEFLAGDPQTALMGPNLVVLNETAAKKYFPNEEALGKTLTLNNDIDLRVNGVMKDLPENSIGFQMLVSVETGRQRFGEDFMAGNAWNRISGTYTFLSFTNKDDAESVIGDLDNFILRNIPDGQAPDNDDENVDIVLEPLSQLYLSQRANFADSNNRPKILISLVVFSVLILLTSCINYANLSLSQLQQRTKEIGVRKTLGANRSHIMIQLIVESLVLTLVAFLLSLPLVYFLIPVYTNITSTGFTFSSAMQSSSVLFLIIFVIATGFLSGLFPALALSRFQIVNIIKGSSIRGNISRVTRSLITIFQFALSSSLMILAIAISLQINHLGSMEIGFNKEDMVYFQNGYNPAEPDGFDFSAMINDLKQHPGIETGAQSSCIPSSVCSISSWRVPGADENESASIGYYEVGLNYLNTLELNLLAGRWFSEDFPADFLQAGENGPNSESHDTRGVVIVRDALAKFGFTSPDDALSKLVLNGDNTFRVIGVIENFKMNGGLEDPDRTVHILQSSLSPLRVLVLRLDPNQTESSLSHINQVWERHRGDVPIDIKFFEQEFNNKIYTQTNGVNKSANFASLVTIIIAIFGLYGLAYYSAQKRIKEVGVRKVLGANSQSIMALLTWDFLKPVMIGCLLACGIAYFAINYFFQQFSSHVDISILVYIFVSIAMIMMSIMTVISQSYKAANSDPVESLRYE